MRKVYFDTNNIIYFIESDGEAMQKIARLLYRLIEEKAEIFTSEIAIAECFYGAFKRQDIILEAKYNQLFFEEDLFNLVAIDLPLLLAASQAGAKQGLKLIDAIHFQSAISANCDAFITNDLRFHSRDALKVYHLSDLT